MRGFKIEKIFFVKIKKIPVWLATHKKSGFSVIFHSEELAKKWVADHIKYKTKF